MSSSTTTDSSTSISEIDERTGKPTGVSFLPEETIERAKAGSPIEKIKMAKDGTSAFVDVYEYAQKIRDGEMTWEDVEKADLDTVRCSLRPKDAHVVKNLITTIIAPKMGRNAASRETNSWKVHVAS